MLEPKEPGVYAQPKSFFKSKTLS
jgi:hypothetical protein